MISFLSENKVNLGESVTGPNPGSKIAMFFGFGLPSWAIECLWHGELVLFDYSGEHFAIGPSRSSDGVSSYEVCLL